MVIPVDFIQAIQIAIRNQSKKIHDNELTKEEKRELRKLNSLIDQESKMQV